MLPEADLPLRLLDKAAYLDFLGPQDEPWLRVLLAEMTRFEGRHRRELCLRLAEPLPCEAPHFKRRAATRVLLKLWRREGVARVAGLRPIELRSRAFALAAACESPRASVVASVAKHLGLAAEELTEQLFGDLPSERLVRSPLPMPSAGEIALRTNLAIAQAVLMRASAVELCVEGGVRPIVRLAKLRGLLCVVTEQAQSGDDGGGPLRGVPMVHISGPFSLFRHTLIYGRALAELLPHLAWCARFRLRATCLVWGRSADVFLESGDPIFPANAPKPFDSKLEERFARDVQRLAPDWDVIREPEPLRAGATLIFPDFLLRHRIHRDRRVLVEIVGFWTPEYLTAKLERLRRARLGAFVLCVDQDRACADGDLPAGLPVVRFRRRVDAATVMREVERVAALAE